MRVCVGGGGGEGCVLLSVCAHVYVCAGEGTCIRACVLVHVYAYAKIHELKQSLCFEMCGNTQGKKRLAAVCMCVCVRTYVCTCAHVCVHVCKNACVCMHLCVRTRQQARVCERVGNTISIEPAPDMIRARSRHSTACLRPVTFSEASLR